MASQTPGKNSSIFVYGHSVYDVILACFNVHFVHLTMQYTPQEYTDMIICYGSAGESSRAAERLYADRFPNRRHPTGQTILNCIQRTKETGSVLNQRLGGGVVYRSLKNEEKVLRVYTNNPGISIRQIARIVGISPNTVRGIIQDEGLQQFEEMEDQDEVPLSIRLQFLKNNAKRRQGSPMKTRQKWKLKKDKNRIEIKNEIDKNQIDENQINENHIDENHIDENHIDENHIDENHTDENHTDENHIDENHIDENHIDENHIDENQIQIDEKLWLFEPEFIDCGS